MLVVGGGLGGLLTASLASRRTNVILFEKSRTLGGRFRNFDRDGFQLTTGALHMIPHGSSGPIAEILRMVNANINIIDSYPWGTFLINGKERRFSQIRKEMTNSEKLKISRLLFEMRYTSGPNKSVKELFEERFNDGMLLNIVRCFLGWSVSASPEDVNSQDLYAIAKNVFKYGGPGVPTGGCTGVINAITESFEKKNVNLVQKKIEHIIVEDGVAKGVETSDGDAYYDDIIVSDVGIKETIRLCKRSELDKGYLRSIDMIPESGGIKINLSSKEPLIGHNGVLFPADTERVEGINQVTNSDPNLAPEGKHLVMSHQTLRGKNIKKETERGIRDLEEIFKGKEFEPICAQSYFGKNPVNRASQGHDVPSTFPVDGMYIVGDSAKGVGGIEVEGIALGVMRLSKLLGLF